MTQENRLRQLLESVADTVVVGLMVLVASLPLVTSAAALSAAGAVLAAEDTSGSLPRRYLDALRPRLRPGVPVTVLTAGPTLVAVVDVVWALSGPLTPLRTLVLSAGVLLGLSSVLVGAVAAADMTGPVQGGAGALLRRSALIAAAAPHRAAPPVLTALLGTAVAVALPVTLPLVLGLLARSLHRTLERGPGQLLRPATRTPG